MENPIPQPIDQLASLLRRNIAGIILLAIILKIKTHTQDVMQAVLDALTSKDDAYRAARDARANAQAELDRVVAQSNEFIIKMITSFKLILGLKWNESWQQVGMIGPTLARPATHARRESVLQKTAQYLTGHPAAEDPSVGLTAVAAQALFDSYKDAMDNVQAATAEVGEKRAALDAAAEAATVQERGLIKELWTLMSDTDPRWRNFGLNPPGCPEVPGRVENLLVTPQLAGMLYLEWGTAPRAARYLVEMQLMAPDAEWTLMTTVAETSVTLTELTPGANVLLRVTAANDGGEGVPSEPVQAQVPAALAA